MFKQLSELTQSLKEIQNHVPSLSECGSGAIASFRFGLWRRSSAQSHALKNFHRQERQAGGFGLWFRGWDDEKRRGFTAKNAKSAKVEALEI